MISQDTRDSALRNDAIHAVFNTIELLELILTYLPARDLLLLQRVCTLWHKIISRSQTFQQTLFFIADESLPSRPPTPDFSPLPMFPIASAPSFGWTPPPCSKPRPDPSLATEATDIENTTQIPKPNPLLTLAFPTGYPSMVFHGPPRTGLAGSILEFPGILPCPSRGPTISFTSSTSAPVPTGKLTKTTEGTFSMDRRGLMNAGASWRRMLMSQPPCTSLILIRPRPRAGHVMVSSETGITMGMFLDAACDAAAGRKAQGEEWDGDSVGGERLSDLHEAGRAKVGS